MATFRHSHQLAQLRRLDPAAAYRAELILHNNAPALAAKVIVEAMQIIFNRLTNPVERFWENIISLIESQRLPITPGGMIEVGHLNGKTISLHRRHDDHLCLYDGQGHSSAPLALLGRDWDNLNSAFAGKWKFIDDTPSYNEGDARRIFDAWLEEKPSIRYWRKTTGGWGIK